MIALAVASSMSGGRSQVVGSPAAKGNQSRWALALHGGAGRLPEDMSDARRQDYERALDDALRAGADVLSSGGTAVDAVEAVIVMMEDEPVFNAGRGAALNIEGEAQLDASIMDGRTLDAGGVCAVRRVKNPIRAARAVMEQTEHVLLAGAGGDGFAADAGLTRVEPDYFVTARRLAAVERRRSQQGLPPLFAEPTGGTAAEDEPGETVGCVALDVHGNLAAGTSTGGRTGKLVGRVGDSPIVGAGTYADNRSAAVSGTGKGEQYIRHAIAARVAWLIQQGQSPEAAAMHCLKKVLDPGDGGLIVLDRAGRVAMFSSTGSMPRGFADSTGALRTAIWEAEP